MGRLALADWNRGPLQRRSISQPPILELPADHGASFTIVAIVWHSEAFQHGLESRWCAPTDVASSRRPEPPASTQERLLHIEDVLPLS